MFCVIMLKIDGNFERKMTCGFINDMKNLVNFTRTPEIFKISLWKTFSSMVFNVDLKKLQRSYVLWHSRVTGELKNDMRNLVNNHRNCWKSEKFHFDGPFLSIAYKVSAKNVQKSYRYDTEEWSTKLWRKPNFLFEKWHKQFAEY